MSFLTSKEYRVVMPSWLSKEQKDLIREQLPRHLSICEHHDASLRSRRVQVEVVEVASYTAKTLKDAHVAVAFSSKEEFDSFVEVEGSQPRGHHRNYLTKFVGEHTLPAARDLQEYHFYPTVVRAIVLSTIGHRPLFRFSGRELLPKISE